MIRAYVADDPCFLSVRLSIVNHQGDDAYPAEVLRLIGREDARPDFKWEPLTPGAQVEPTLAVPDSMGRALLDALAHHYSGTEDARALRRDYDAALARNDKLTDALIALAETLATPTERPAVTEPAPQPAIESACAEALESWGLLLRRTARGYSVSFAQSPDEVKFVFSTIEQVTDFTDARAKAER